MAVVHNVKIIWDELMNAFTNGQDSRIYFLDKHTGEIFHVPATLEDDDFWKQIESNRDRFLEIPRFDYAMERQIMADFITSIEDASLKTLLKGSMTGIKPYGKIGDILPFYPEEFERLEEIKDEYHADRVKQWLETNNLFTVESNSLSNPQI
jgi:hypothetical protein